MTECIYNIYSLKHRLSLCKNCKEASFSEFGVYCNIIKGYAISSSEIKKIVGG